ncbi:EexN family lipoprotein [Aggregatibacter actinomycetemcomitans]|uniref:EexN family lipoprotein n=1 Tax=Aggregatibacter actinomycetemcomitans TaxID=714 RepID=UPI00197BF0F5|nr:EexN family lipoprotein [Aggregatibacter actinomycetemcomitans]MBN6078476.1 EexN family lipoprotein [Aggregatibacter actinomycetemcomitans]
MNNSKKAFPLLLVSLFLFGCEDKVYSRDELTRDISLRNKLLQKCDNGELHPEDLNCINARKVDFIEKTVSEKSGERF